MNEISLKIFTEYELVQTPHILHWHYLNMRSKMCDFPRIRKKFTSHVLNVLFVRENIFILESTV